MLSSLRKRQGDHNDHRIPIQWTCISKVELCGRGGHPNTWHKRGAYLNGRALDPKNIEAMVGLATVDAVVGGAHFADERAAHLAAAEATVVKALSFSPNHAFAHSVLGAVLNMTNRAAQGIAECERALALDRNLAAAHWEIGVAKYYVGRAAETETHINEGLRLSPRDMLAYHWLMFLGLAKLQLTADAEAVSWFRRAIEANRNYPMAHFYLAAGATLPATSCLGAFWTPAS